VDGSNFVACFVGFINSLQARDKEAHLMADTSTLTDANMARGKSLMQPSSNVCSTVLNVPRDIHTQLTTLKHRFVNTSN